MDAADISKASGDSVLNFHKLLNQKQFSAFRNKYHIGNCCIIYHTWAKRKSVCQAVSQMFIHGREVTRSYTHTQRHKLFTGSFLPNRGTMLVYYLWKNCFAGIIYTFNTGDDIKSWNFVCILNAPVLCVLSVQPSLKPYLMLT